MKIKEIIKLIEAIDADYENAKIRIIVKTQEKLKPEDKWGKYLRAPMIYFKLITSPKVTKLGKIDKVEYAVKTGANEFFILSEEKMKLWGIEKEFLTSIIKTPRDVKFIKVEADDVKDKILVVNKPREKLQGKNALKYIEYGEQQGYDNRSSVRSRKFWYDVGEHTPAPILLPYIIRDRFFCVWNCAGALATDVF